MKSYEERKAEQDSALAIYEDVKAELMRLPGVVSVGIGIKERGGALTEEMAFRVYVSEKRSLVELPMADVVPATIRGFRTDVLNVRRPELAMFFNDENDERNYKIKVGGSRIGIDVMPLAGSHGGTLGCFVRMADGSPAILSNYHVLAPGLLEPIEFGVGVGQPDHSGSLCCTCNEIANVEAGVALFDCAIAKLKKDVAFAPKIRRIRRPDGTVEQEGAIKGEAAIPVWGNDVWKVGFKTGLTRGTIAEAVLPSIGVELHPSAPFPKFMDKGDSGSLVVDTASGKPVALLYGRSDADKRIGLAHPMVDVLNALNITIIPTDPTAVYEVSAREEARLAVAGPSSPDEAFAAVADRLRMTEEGARLLDLFRRHRHECQMLVNSRARVALAWRGCQGPAWVAALMRSAREPNYSIPDAIEGVSRTSAMTALRDVFSRHGSSALRGDLEQHADLVADIARGSATVSEMIDSWERRATGIVVGTGRSM